MSFVSLPTTSPTTLSYTLSLHDALPRRVPHAFEHVHQILGADVSGRPRRERTTAQPPEACLVMLDSRCQSREDVGKPHPPGIVEMQGELQFGPALPHRGAQIQDLLGMPHSGGVGKSDAAHPQLDIAADELQHPPRRMPAFARSTECGGKRARHGDSGSLELAHDFTESLE